MKFSVILALSFMTANSWAAEFFDVCERSDSVRRALENRTNLHCSEIGEDEIKQVIRLRIVADEPFLRGDLQKLEVDELELMLATSMDLRFTDLGIFDVPRLKILVVSDAVTISGDSFTGSTFDRVEISVKKGGYLKIETFGLATLAHTVEIETDDPSNLLLAPGAFDGALVKKLILSELSKGLFFVDPIPAKVFRGLAVGTLDMNRIYVRQVSQDAFYGLRADRVFMQSNGLSEDAQQVIIDDYPDLKFSF